MESDLFFLSFRFASWLAIAIGVTAITIVIAAYAWHERSQKGRPPADPAKSS